MKAPRLSDHALVRLLARSGLDVEAIRAATERALARAHTAAEALGGADHLIVVDGLCYVVREGVVTTIVEAVHPGQLAGALKARGRA